MNIKTIARLFTVAAGSLLGEYGNSAIYHLGTALALASLENTLEDDYNGFDRQSEIARHVRMAKGYFLAAKREKAIRNFNQDIRAFHGSCRSTECEAAYLQCE